MPLFRWHGSNGSIQLTAFRGIDETLPGEIQRGEQGLREISGKSLAGPTKQEMGERNRFSTAILHLSPITWLFPVPSRRPK